jgi:regulatory protein YycI of two-component signal transduction system YycFG
MPHIIPSHINQYRTENYRVFLASPYFNIDLEQEIKWNKAHLKKLHHQKNNPLLFHRERTSGQITQDHDRHFKEHVIEAIPFHQKILSDHEKRLKTIKELIPHHKYKKLVGISMKQGGTPEYFVYDKQKKYLFFVAEHLTPERKRWINLVRDKHKLSEVLILG